MKSDIINLNQAMILKRLGYQNKVRFAYKISEEEKKYTLLFGDKKNWNSLKEYYSAPTIQSAKRWINLNT